ncbi:store-operated calcium entry-associated regulatory factor-like isoform X1 [Daphnia pulicaria]|uniref:store-operated calcium entry-associated regulatory factor-like isoform X1 n=1 Tax=Daphnia pulicaria TaxID=35523 RepID=UPI001EECD988|nr:store-operated calcium entry-associated regulatory factor-like isoform X1 [Daphnia pulicaria]
MLSNLKSVILVFVSLHVTFGASNPVDYSIQMSKIKVLTLNHGKMTNSRRVPAVPQLKCVGGTAGCRAFIPQVVQCENQGSDGITIQWECKTDMDNSYRFGKIIVICEGYDYPGDHYVLVGSCGLEYNIDLTKEGIDNHPSIPIIDIGPPSINQGTSTELSSLTIFLICFGVLLFVTAIFGLIACIVCSERSSSYHVHSDVPFARPVLYPVYTHRPIYRPTTVYVSNDRTSTAGNRVASSSGTRTASGFGGTMSR